MRTKCARIAINGYKEDKNEFTSPSYHRLNKSTNVNSNNKHSVNKEHSRKFSSLAIEMHNK